MHGGNGKSRLERAAEKVVRTTVSQTYREAAVPDVAPATAMLQAVSWKYAEVVALRARVAELDEPDMVWGLDFETVREGGADEDGVSAEVTEKRSRSGQNIWWKLLHMAEDQLVRYAAAARAAGCDERMVHLAEQQGELVAQVIEKILDDLCLTEDQQLRARPIVSRRLRELSAA